MIPFLLAMDASALPPKAEVIAETATSSLIAQAPEAETEPESSADTPESFPYVGLQLGVGIPNTYDGNFNLLGVPVNTGLELDTGFNGELAIGYQFKQARAEIALGYGNYGVDQQTFNVEGNSSSVPGRGEVDVTTVMLNGYYDFPIRNSDGVKSRWSPYIGAGIGYANIGTPSCARASCFGGGSTSGFAYQGKVGISYRVAERSFAFLEGGYLGSTSGSIDGVSFDDFGAWRVNLGFRVGFGGGER